VGRDISRSINGNYNIQASCPDKLLAKGHIFFIRRAINELQPSRVQILEILSPSEIIEGLSKKGPRSVALFNHDRENERTLGQFATSSARVRNESNIRLTMFKMAVAEFLSMPSMVLVTKSKIC
jgi:hypothetical protein